jgi:tetratricopeptide (TPR) repeat protein
MVVARYEENRGNWEQALKLYSRLDTPYAWLARARIYYVIEDNAASLSELQKVIDEGPYLQEALEMRIRIHARGGNWDKAIKDTEALSRKYPDNIQLKINLANIRIITATTGRRGHPEGAHRKGRRQHHLLHHGAGVHRRTRFHQRQGIPAEDHRGAAEFIPAYLDLAGSMPCWASLHQAEGTYLKLLDVEPFSHEAHLALWEYYIDQKRYRDAIEHLKSVLVTNPDPLVLRKLIVLDLQEGQFEDALNLIRGMKEMTDDDRYYLALAYAGLERYEEALVVLRDIPVSGKMGCAATMVTSSILKNMDRDEESVKVLEDAWQHYADLGTCNEIGYHSPPSSTPWAGGRRPADRAEAPGKGSPGPHRPELRGVRVGGSGHEPGQGVRHDPGCPGDEARRPVHPRLHGLDPL